MPTFSRLELENFKSYRSHTAIEWKQVSSILGQNGTGKSTIIDAVEYVFCFPRYTKKSVASLKKLLYNNNSNDTEHSSSWVSAIVNSPNGERKFKRSVDYNESAHKYWVDDRVVDLNEYTKFLLEVNVNPRANNFLVQQNSIESLALKNAKQRSEFFEVLSGSIIYKSEYNRLVSEMKSMQSEVNSLRSILVSHTGDKNNLTQKCKQIEMYDELSQQLEQLDFEYYYIKLYNIETTIDRLVEQKLKKQNEMKNVERLANEFQENIKKLNDEITEKQRQITDIETNLESCEPKILKYERKRAELMEKIKCFQEKIDKVNKNLVTAGKVDSAHKETMQDLKKEISEIEEEKRKFDVSQTCSLELDNEQYEKYLELKLTAQNKIFLENQSFSPLERMYSSINDKINEYENKKKALSDQIERKRLFLVEISTQEENVHKKLNETKLDIQSTERESEELDGEIKNLSKEVEVIIKKIEAFNDQLSDLDVEEQQSFHHRRLREIIDILKIQFPSKVLDQLSNLCEITDGKKYGIAITKILGKKMDGIVVDATHTATECLEFLKVRYESDRHSAIASFYPLDNFQEKSLHNAILRKIELTSYAKLAIDVMKTRQIDNILRNFLGNIVICETHDQAMELSYSLKIDCVSLNGSYFSKDGTFSGGRSDTSRKAKQWNEEKYRTLDTEKQKATENLRNKQELIRAKKIIRKELQDKLSSLRHRLENYLEPELKKCNEKLKTKKDELQKLENNLKTLESETKYDELRKSLSDLEAQLSNSKKREHEIEDEVFSDFCKSYQLENIRKYEKIDLGKHEKCLKKRTELDEQLSRIKNQLDYERKRNTEAVVSNLEKKKGALEKKRQELMDQIRLENRESKHDQRANNKAEIIVIKRDMDKIKKKIAFEKRKRDAARRDLKEYEKTVTVLNFKIDQLRRVETHQILTKCKVKGIEIPLIEGRIQNVVVRSRILDTESESNGQETESESAIQEKDVEIDFTKLDESIKKLDESGLSDLLSSLEKRQEDLKKKLETCTPSNRNLTHELKELDTKIKDTEKDLKAKQSELKTVQEEFEKVKNKRKELFVDFYISVEKEIDGTFKNLYNDTSAQVCMIMVNPNEPYLAGIGIHCLIPKKRFTMMELLSGGEKTMCAIALFLAIYSAKPAPCIIFDEIDAALDNVNLHNIVRLFLKWKQTTQIISISHHECLFRCADAAIGINISTRRNSSYAIHVDLTQYLQPVNMSPRYQPPLGLPRAPPASPRGSPTSSTGNKSDKVRLPSISSSSRRSTMGEPIHASTPTSTIIIKSVEDLTDNIVTRKRKSKTSEKEDS